MQYPKSVWDSGTDPRGRLSASLFRFSIRDESSLKNQENARSLSGAYHKRKGVLHDESFSNACVSLYVVLEI